MKTSLLTAAVLSSLMITGVARASTPMPPVAPPQFLPIGTPVTPISKPVDAKPAAAKSAAPSDAEALAKEKAAEAEFKGASKKSTKAVVTKSVTVAKALPRKVVRVKAASPVVAAPKVVARRLDAAGLLTARCASLGKKTLKCMNLELARSENQVADAETRVANCRSSRQGEAADLAQSKTVESLVDGEMYKLRFKATKHFNTEIAKAGRANRLETHEIELRATLNHLNAVRELGDVVCSPDAFQMMYERSVAATN